MDINEPKSRSFNMYLRYFQMGLQVFIASKLSQINSTSCEFTFQRVGQFIALIVIALNLISMIVTRCTQHFPRIFFFIASALNLILAAIIVVLGIVGLAEYNSCANNRVLHRFVIVEGLISIILSFMIILLPFHWIQRYSNTPGNLVWILLFFSFGWTSQFLVPMYIQGAIYLIITLMTFVVNIIACRGITTQIKKIIVIQWIFASILMIVGQVLAIVVYLQINNTGEFIGNIAIKIIQTFVCVNILDLLFWIWGYLTLQYQNGDKIRDQLMKGKNDIDQSEDVEPYNMESHQQNPAFGTIRH